jgi:hypothetical protein
MNYLLLGEGGGGVNTIKSKIGTLQKAGTVRIPTYIMYAIGNKPLLALILKVV